MLPERERIALNADGWCSPMEGAALRVAASKVEGAIVEIGSFCGKSTIYLGDAAEDRGVLVYAVDHHRGSSEHQTDHPLTYNWNTLTLPGGGIDTLPQFRNNIRAAGLEKVVVPLVSDSETIANIWTGKVGMLFIDGEHTPEAVTTDYRVWAPHLADHAVVAFDDAGDWLEPAIFRAKWDGFKLAGCVGKIQFMERKPRER